MPSPIAITIVTAAQQFAIYGYFLILIGGVIGNICSILVFTCCKLFRRNQCAFYLIAEAICDCFLLIIVLPFRISELAFAYDTTRASLAWCKLKAMISYTTALIAFSIICFAAIDQYLSTNHHAWLKQLSTLKTSQRLIYITMISWICYGSIFLIFFDIQPTAGCNIYNVIFAYYFSYFHYIVLASIIPILVSSTFSLLAYLNVRRVVLLRVPVVRRKLDKQLTAMVLARVIFFVLTVFPSVLFRLYVINVTVDPNDSIRIAVHLLLSNVSYALFYINTAATFYVYLIISSRFRRQIKHTFNVVKRCCKAQTNNQVAPVSGQLSELE